MPKRLFDLTCAALSLLLLSPLLLGIALWIKLDSPGPVFYRQQRVGRAGVLFRIHKFRSMRDDPSSNALQITVAADPRKGSACDDIRAGYRKFPVGSHVLFFREVDSGIDIVRILHSRMDFARHL